MDLEELKKYAQSAEFKEDLKEAGRCIQEKDLDGLYKLASRDNEGRARAAAARVRGMKPEETERERMLHAMFDALSWLDHEADFIGGQRGERFAQPARAILRGQLEAAQYPPYLIYKEER